MKSDRIHPGRPRPDAGGFCFALYTSLHETIVNAGDKAPNFSITADNGKTVTARDFGGKLLLLNFWATWCPPCIEEIPGLNEISRQLGPERPGDPGRQRG
jgi:thiol-disulfide isomerase/thioredoxin